MLDLIRTKRAIAFVGAGVSRALGYPTWDTLTQRLATETRTQCGEQIVDDQGRSVTVTQVSAINDLLFQAEIFKSNLQGRYYQILQEIFAPRGANADVRDLVSLPFQHLLTSNYDVALESAHDELQSRCESLSLCDHTAVDFINNLADYEYGRHVVHVHGRYDDPHNIILTQKEYADFYHRSPEAEALWNMLPIIRRCVFFGFSFTDKDLTEGFNLSNFNRAQRGHPQVVHFALVPMGEPEREPALRAWYSSTYGIDPVFFDGVDAKFTGYSVLIRDIAKEFETRAEPSRVGLDGGAPAEVVHVQQEPLQPENIEQQPPAANIQADIARLEQLTEDNIRRRSTGDLE